MTFDGAGKNGRNYSKPIQVAEIFRSILADKGIDKQLQYHQVYQTWETIVGGRIAKVAFPVQIRDGTLRVNVTNSVWLHQLSLIKQNIIRKLNTRLGQEVISDIHFKLGKPEYRQIKVPESLDVREEVEAVELPPRIVSDIDDSLVLVESAGVKNTVRELMLKHAKYKIWKAKKKTPGFLVKKAPIRPHPGKQQP
jgi:hypothetical protein